MQNDDESRCLISMTKAAHLRCLQVDGRQMSTATICRWASRGRANRSGQRILLQSVRIGGKLATSERWVREFLDSINDGAFIEGRQMGGEGDVDVDKALAALGI